MNVKILSIKDNVTIIAVNAVLKGENIEFQVELGVFNNGSGYSLKRNSIPVLQQICNNKFGEQGSAAYHFIVASLKSM